jgi:alanine-glyoxylate transaminase / serine-glyoxylate transaminase / serine-pyruvate transaminase
VALSEIPMEDTSHFGDLDPSPRLLLGPGPSMMPSRVLRAMSAPPVGHLDPDFLSILDEVHQMLCAVFETANELTIAVPGTGTSAMEAALSNLIEPGDAVLACVAGYFGDRLATLAVLHGGEVTRLEKPWGAVFSPEEIEAALRHKPARVVTLVHAETSTGAWQPEIAAIAAAAHQFEALLILDVVTSLGGLPVKVDAWDVDVAYGAAQKCLSGPSGLAPITVGARARQRMAVRTRPPGVFYLDLEGLLRYWSHPHTYHHTSPIQAFYGLREALRLVLEEGLDARVERHRGVAAQLWQTLEDLGLRFVQPLPLRLPTLSTPWIPDGVEDAAVRQTLLHTYNIEIAGGFGPLAGKIWRIGLMGHSCRPENVLTLAGALRQILPGRH